jgi:predicted SprT family Zn-dependent metalloprotease
MTNQLLTEDISDYYITKDNERKAQIKAQKDKKKSDTLNNFPDPQQQKDNNLNINSIHLNRVNDSDTKNIVSIVSQNQKTSIIPIIQECERFLNFLNTELKLNINMPVIHLSRDKDNILGCYQSTKNEKGFKKIISSNGETGTYKTENIHTIQLNTLHLKDINSSYNVFETLTHEIAHYLNDLKGINDTSSNGYHNHFFKIQAQNLGLIIKKRTNKGYSKTELSEELSLIIKEKFNPNLKVFNLIQENLKNKQKSRLFLYECSCFDKNKIRSGYTDLNIKCLRCAEDFVFQEAK